MNGKKAKMLRKQVKPFLESHGETVYEDTNEKTRIVPFLIPRQIKVGEEEVPVLDENGTQMINDKAEPITKTQPITINAPHYGGNPMQNNSGGVPQYAQVKTYTRELGMCARKMYLALKAQYLQSIRA
jgi:hypothetical protein